MITLHLLGDSLVKAYGNDTDNFIGGWGDHLESFFDKDYVNVKDYANGGRSSRSFLNEGRFIDNGLFTKDQFPYNLGPAYDNIKEGDFCLLEFCHNDDNSKGKATYIDRMTPIGTPGKDGIYPTVVPTADMMVSTASFPEEYPGVLVEDGMTQEEINANIEKYTEILASYNDKYYSYRCGATFKGYYKFYIDMIRAKKATPVLVTPPARQFYEDGKIASIPGNHGGSDEFGPFKYVRALKQLGQEENVVVVDLFDFTVDFLEHLGKKDASYLQSIVGLDGNTLGESMYGRAAKWPEDYDTYRENGNFKKVDDTHTNRLGSFIYASVIAKELSEKCPELSVYKLKTPSKEVAYPEMLKSYHSEFEKIILR
ncbi:MAG: hypothetical protein K6A23_01095 [Butyrivibrio sp.]|nr:hypothetical protein [Butyrivibrio sp.]